MRGGKTGDHDQCHCQPGPAVMRLVPEKHPEHAGKNDRTIGQGGGQQRPATGVSMGHRQLGGGAGKNAFPDRSMVTEFTSVPDTISKWSKLNGCEGKAERFLQKPGYYCEKFAKCKATVQLQLCVTETGGHSWPGGKNPRRGKADPSDAFSATDLIWDFFKSQK